jgi:hypothetical protein
MSQPRAIQFCMPNLVRRWCDRKRRQKMRGILAMPKRKARAKSATRRRQRPPSEWTVLSRYLRQMAGHDLDAYARLIATLKDRFAQLDDPEVWNRLRFEEGCIRLEMDRRGYDPVEEYEARRYGPNHLDHEIMMQ